MNKQEKQNGNVLLYAILIIAAILSTTILASNLISNSLKRTRYINDAQATYYSAESAAERLIYLVRQDQIPGGDCDLAEFDCEWQVEESVVDELELDLDRAQKMRFALYDPERDFFGGDVRSIEFNWQAADPTENPPRLDVVWQIWEWELGPGGPEVSLLEEEYDSLGGGQAVLDEFDPNEKYLIDVTTNGPVRNLRVKIYRDRFQLQPKTFPDFLRLNLTGRYQNSSRNVIIDMLKYASLPGLPAEENVYDYVVYK